MGGQRRREQGSGERTGAASSVTKRNMTMFLYLVFLYFIKLFKLSYALSDFSVVFTQIISITSILEIPCDLKLLPFKSLYS